MRPALKAGLLPVWRNRDTLQIGIDPRRAVALTGMSEAGRLVQLLDGSRDRAQVLSAAGDLGIAPAAADRALTLLAVAGALDDVPPGRGDVAAGIRSRLASELATAGIAAGTGDGGARTLARRQAASVRVHGSTETGLLIASLLSAAGVGQVVTTGSAGSAGDRSIPPPGVASPAAAGVDSAAAHAASPRPPAPRAAAPPGLRPDLVVLADSQRRDLPAALVRDLVPHLTAGGSEAIGVVGPLVLPGRSACLRCLDLSRSDRDPAWPLILAQLSGRAADPPACGVVLAASVAAQAAAQALIFVDRAAPAEAVINGTLELVLPDWQWHRRTWEPHQRCGCGTVGAS